MPNLNSATLLKQIILISLVALLIGCGVSNMAGEQTAVRPTTSATPPTTAVSATFTPTPSTTPTATATATPTLTPTNTPTPTPTALTIPLLGNPRAVTLATPMPQGNAPCGLVDVFDFPLDPPHAETITRGGQDFGVYRSRYSKYHAGEDWWLSSGSSLGEPVYSIGHGIVTYAAPLGWGRDQGVVIVRHTFANGRTTLSFYGHLDPPSVTLRMGDCVQRGEQIGEIGKPKTSPHLHFEIRDHMPFEPGPGYWSEDPTSVGWRPPSQTIWQQRLTAVAGLQWLHPPTATPPQPITLYNEEGLLILEDESLRLLNPADGTISWTLPSDLPIHHAQLDRQQPILYAANRLGELVAFALPSTTTAVTELWRITLTPLGNATLLPLPDGGLLAYTRQTATAVSPTGDILWQNSELGQLSDSLLMGDRLLLVTAGTDTPLWLVDQTGMTPLPINLHGSVTQWGDEVLLYARDGLYRLDLDQQTAVLHQSLSPSYIWLSKIAVNDDGRFLLPHADTFDRRLLAFNADGTLAWERSYATQLRGDVRPFVSNGRFYLLTINQTGSLAELDIYALNWDDAQLSHIFTGGTRSAQSNAHWLWPLPDGRVILNIGGGHLLAIDLLVASTAVAP